MDGFWAPVAPSWVFGFASVRFKSLAMEVFLLLTYMKRL
jgi:hypothetical protein